MFQEICYILHVMPLQKAKLSNDILVAFISVTSRNKILQNKKTTADETTTVREHDNLGLLLNKKINVQKALQLP